MTAKFNPYGNAPVGIHTAIFHSVCDVRFPLGPRTIVAFLILAETGDEPLLSDVGEPYFGVAVCNASEGVSPKSKTFKIRKAMLHAVEFEPIRCATEVPDWDHFKSPAIDGKRRMIKVQVEHIKKKDGECISAVVAILRPRDGEWENIEGKFEGKVKSPTYSWLTADGQRKTMSVKEEAALPTPEKRLYTYWVVSQPAESPWKGVDGQFRELSKDEVDQLRSDHRGLYEVAKIRAERGWRNH